MKKTLLALSLISMFSLAACSDGFMLRDDKSKEENSASKSEHVNDLGEKHWKIDPSKKIKLYRIFVDRDNNNCKSIVQVSDQMDMEECLHEKEQHIEADYVQKDYSKQDMKDIFGIENGEPVKRLARFIPKDPSKPLSESNKIAVWIYKCSSDTAEQVAKLNGDRSLTLCK